MHTHTHAYTHGTGALSHTSESMRCAWAGRKRRCSNLHEPAHHHVEGEVGVAKQWRSHSGGSRSTTHTAYARSCPLPPAQRKSTCAQHLAHSPHQPHMCMRTRCGLSARAHGPPVKVVHHFALRVFHQLGALQQLRCLRANTQHITLMVTICPVCVFVRLCVFRSLLSLCFSAYFRCILPL